MRPTTVKLFSAGLFLHLLLIFATSLRDLSSLLADGGNIFPGALHSIWKQTESFASTISEAPTARSNVLQQTEGLYARCAGIESGYSFFAPNVPNSYKLAFEILHSDQTTDVVLPEVGSEAAGLRLATLLENLGQIPSEPLRKRTLQKLAYVAWASHPDAIRIRAIFGEILIPDLHGYERGAKQSYEVICAYDFFPQTRKL